MGKRIVMSSALLALLLPGAAMAGDTGEQGRVYGLALDNDVFMPNGTDRYYTHGTRLAVRQAPGQRPFWAGLGIERLPIWSRGSALIPETGVSQLIFTPARIDRVRPNPTDRPYAGMTSISMGYTGMAPEPVSGAQRIDQFTLTLGIIGPAALAGEAQDLVHRVRELDRPLGWKSQLGTEPAINVAWRRGWRVGGRSLDVTPYAGAAVGNVHVHAEAGATLRLGAGLGDVAPGALDPVQPGLSGRPASDRLLIHLVASAGGRVVARNLFIDGNSFTAGRNTQREPLVGEARIGIVGRWRWLQLSYLHNWRSIEFARQRGPHRFGSLVMSVAL